LIPAIYENTQANPAEDQKEADASDQGDEKDGNMPRFEAGCFRFFGVIVHIDLAVHRVLGEFFSWPSSD
jgi:hypothetical protein